MVEWRYERGSKGPYDWLLLIKTNSWEILSFEDLLRLLEFCFLNEDRIYPKSEGYRGRDMLLQAINRVGKGESVPVVLSDYQLTCKKLWLHEFM